jgi:predicted dehydrogenase
MTPDHFRPVRLAIVGCGAHTEFAHLPAAIRSPLIDLTALIDSDLERAAVLKRKYGCSAVIADRLEAVVDFADAVVIVTPNHAHKPLTEVALRHGIHAFVQKPMSTNYPDALALCELARTEGLVIAVGFQGRHFPCVKLMKRLVEEGFFGKIAGFHCEFGARGGYSSLSGYNLSRDQAGGGILVTAGTHYLDRMLYWFGEPTKVEFADDSYGGVEGNCKGSLQFVGGIEGSFFFSKSITLKNKFVFQTERYVVELPAFETERLTLFPRERPGIKMEIGECGGNSGIDYLQQVHQVELEDFARCIRTGSRPVVDGMEGARSVRVCDALYACRTQLPEPWAWYRQATQRAAVA